MTAATYAFAQLLRVLPRTGISRAVGLLSEMSLSPVVSRAVVGAYARAYRVDLDEAEPPRAHNGSAPAWASFDAFFTRRLREGARVIDAPSRVLVSPADGQLHGTGVVDERGLMTIKRRAYRAADLLGDERDGPDHARRFRGGQFAIVYLSPRDYHRVHAPSAGELSLVRSYPGDLFPVNRVSEAHVRNYLGRNRRVVLEIATEALGLVSVVMVAALIVGRVTVAGIDARDVPLGSHRPSVRLDRGDEMAVFHLGSTVVMFLEPGACPALDRPLGAIKLGDPLFGAPAAGPGQNGGRHD